MHAFNFKRQLCAMALLLLISVGASVQAATLSVNCGGNYGLTSINAAIKALQSSEESQGPATINVSGACHENIRIQHMDRLTLNAVNRASITDASRGGIDTVGIVDSTDITVSGFTVSGGFDAFSITNSSVRLIDITAQSAVYDGVGVYTNARVFFVNGTLQNNGYAGLIVWRGDAGIYGVTTQGNVEGIDVNFASRVIVSVSDPFYSGVNVAAPAIIRNNQDAGVLVAHNASFNCAS